MWSAGTFNGKCLFLLAVVLLLAGCGSTEPNADEEYFQDKIDQQYQAQEATSMTDRITEFYSRPEDDIATKRRISGMEQDLQRQQHIDTLFPERDTDATMDDFVNGNRIRGMQEDLRRQQQQIDRLKKRAYDPDTKSRVNDLQRQQQKIDTSVADRISGFPSRPENDFTTNSRIRGTQEDIRQLDRQIEALNRRTGGGAFGY